VVDGASAGRREFTTPAPPIEENVYIPAARPSSRKMQTQCTRQRPVQNPCT